MHDTTTTGTRAATTAALASGHPGLTSRDIHHLRQVRAACQSGGWCKQRTAALELAAAVQAAAPDLADTDIATRLMRLTAQAASEDPAGARLIALTAAIIADRVLDEEPAHV